MFDSSLERGKVNHVTSWAGQINKNSQYSRAVEIKRRLAATFFIAVNNIASFIYLQPRFPDIISISLRDGN